jgi:ubiquinone/menaquinone biosynthesis C-methylase UbiE
MNAQLQRRIQRYGWDSASEDYEPLWSEQLAAARLALLARAAMQHGERVLDVACGTGLVTFDAARAVGPEGRVLGVDLSGKMVDAARHRASQGEMGHVTFARMDAETLALPDGSFDVALCALGLMYVPDPLQAVREMCRIVRPGGRIGLAVWGERSNCGWAPVFPIVDAEVSSDVCPLFFSLGARDALAQLCAQAGLVHIVQERINATLIYSDAEEACDAAFVGGPVALAWSRFDADTRRRVRARYVEAIAPWACNGGYRIPGEFVVVSALAPAVEIVTSVEVDAGPQDQLKNRQQREYGAERPRER